MPTKSVSPAIQAATLKAQSVYNNWIRNGYVNSVGQEVVIERLKIHVKNILQVSENLKGATEALADFEVVFKKLVQSIEKEPTKQQMSATNLMGVLLNGYYLAVENALLEDNYSYYSKDTLEDKFTYCVETAVHSLFKSMNREVNTGIKMLSFKSLFNKVLLMVGHKERVEKMIAEGIIRDIFAKQEKKVVPNETAHTDGVKGELKLWC